MRASKRTVERSFSIWCASENEPRSRRDRSCCEKRSTCVGSVGAGVIVAAVSLMPGVGRGLSEESRDGHEEADG